ncbi:MAG: hypothetical protein KF691_06325 [Phycisphaeraceae bacterium]|nr:hypothetical protein [Phycisphaeraceae bacterium]
MSEQQPGSGGLLFKLGLVVLSIGLCALSMLVMRQARLQAGHEVTQTQLRIQRADEQLWKMRADIAALSNPARVRELAGTMGPMHALINPVETRLNPSFNVAIPMIEKIQPVTRASRIAPANSKPSGIEKAKAPSGTGSTEKPGDKSEKKPGHSAPAKPRSKPDSKTPPRTTGVSPTGLAAIPVSRDPDLDR